MKILYAFKVFLMSVATIFAVGCADGTDVTGETAPIGDLPPDTIDDHAHEHAHPSEGPHHGDLVELGNEEYHGEVVHDEGTGGVTIYILDGSATTQVAIDAPHVAVNVKHDGKPEQFKLAASPEEGEAAGNSSRFVTDDAELGQLLDEEGSNPQLVVKISGKSFRGSISHNHDHAGHDHSHDEDKK